MTLHPRSTRPRPAGESLNFKFLLTVFTIALPELTIPRKAAPRIYEGGLNTTQKYQGQFIDFPGMSPFF
jgi:hypothetical protein